jgi:predicted nucleic acid-binding protein
VAALFDTSVAVLLIRRSVPAAAGDLMRAAEQEIASGTAILPAVAISELLIGERSAAVTELSARLRNVPTAVLPVDAAADAGVMGAFLSGRGASVPLPDLFIAATAVWLGIPLLAWDSDYARASRLAHEEGGGHPGARLWRSLRLHPSTLRA